MLHPVVPLLTWLIFAIGLQWLALSWLIVVAGASFVLACLTAAERTANLLRRSRWLLLSLVVLYGFATPGEYLPGIPGDIGMSWDGLHHGAVQLGRLLAMLTSLAVLHQAVGTHGLLAGLHSLLKPFPWRAVTVLRLMLVLDYVERKQQIGWREWLAPQIPNHETLPDRLTLTVPHFRWIDVIVLLFIATLLPIAVFWA